MASLRPPQGQLLPQPLTQPQRRPYPATEPLPMRRGRHPDRTQAAQTDRPIQPHLAVATGSALLAQVTRPTTQPLHQGLTRSGTARHQAPPHRQESNPSGPKRLPQARPDRANAHNGRQACKPRHTARSPIQPAPSTSRKPVLSSPAAAPLTGPTEPTPTTGGKPTSPASPPGVRSIRPQAPPASLSCRHQPPRPLPARRGRQSYRPTQPTPAAARRGVEPRHTARRQTILPGRRTTRQEAPPQSRHAVPSHCPATRATSPPILPLHSATANTRSGAAGHRAPPHRQKPPAPAIR